MATGVICTRCLLPFPCGCLCTLFLCIWHDHLFITPIYESPILLNHPEVVQPQVQFPNVLCKEMPSVTMSADVVIRDTSSFLNSHIQQGERCIILQSTSTALKQRGTKAPLSHTGMIRPVCLPAVPLCSAFAQSPCQGLTLTILTSLKPHEPRPYTYPPHNISLNTVAINRPLCYTLPFIGCSVGQF